MPSAVGPDHELRRYAVPVQPRPFRLTVGTRPSPRWLLPGPDGPTQRELKRQLLIERPDDVVVVQPEAAGAVAALGRMVAAEVSPGAIGETDVGRISLAVQEDLCVLQRDADGVWRLTAGCVCFPSHWRLRDKVGQDLDAIHTTVPDYADRLAAASRGVFDRIAGAPDSGVWERFNWTLTADDDLFHPTPVPEVPMPWQEVPTRLWLRTERQSLRASPDGVAVVFAIRTFLTRIGDLTSTERAALATSLPGVSPELARYRSALGYRDAVQEWLRLREPV
jgi:hypothetical protein